jgi:hypothetical protein
VEKVPKKAGRVSIPLKVQNQLWARTAGRCEFRGCNKILYTDDLTTLRDNLSVISHIIAYEKDGPRGDEKLSDELKTDISNLMLTCKDHGKIVDSQEYVASYSVELLREYKKEHEGRIKLLTGISENFRTHVLLFNVPISGRAFNIDQSQVFQAIQPRYPTTEHPYIIDLSEVCNVETHDGWKFLGQTINQKFNDIFKHGVNRRDFHHLSIFALAPIPLLVFLGSLIGDIDHVDLYHKHRSTGKWTWKDESEDFCDDCYLVTRPEHHNPLAKTALVISISGEIDKANILGLLGEDCNLYEIKAKKPGLDFLTSRVKLQSFCTDYREMLKNLRSVNGHYNQIHLFSAVPPPVAIECGRALLPKSDPPIRVYDFIASAGGFTGALTINE